MSKTFEDFKEYLCRMEQYNRAVSQFYWDMETTTPSEGFEGQAQALTFFSTEHFKMQTSPEMKHFLEVLSSR